MTIIYMLEADCVSANALSQLDDSTTETILQFDESWSHHPAEITLLAHTDSERLTLGGKTPAQLAKDFTLKIPAKKRETLHDLYLISCEAGLAQGNTPSLAQQFAHEMQKKGFLNLQVHAVRCPDDKQMAGMRVEVMSYAGISGKPRGYVQAFGLPTPYCEALECLSEEINQRIGYLEQALSKVSAEKKNIIYAELNQKRQDFRVLNESLGQDPRYMKVALFSTLSYKDDMKKDYHTYTAGDSKSASCVKLMAMSYFETEKLNIARQAENKEQKQHIELLNQYIVALEQKAPFSIEEVECILYEITPRTEGKKKAKNQSMPKAAIQFLRDQFKKLEGLNHDRMSDFSPEIACIAARTAYCKQLTEYHELRSSNDWGYHYNFLNLVSLVYLILDFCTGSDHFNSQKRAVKLSATEKVIRHINGEHIKMAGDELLSANKSSHFFNKSMSRSLDSNDVLTKSELNALKQGRLGKIVADHGGVEALLKHSQQPKHDSHQRLHEIVKKYRP